MQPRKTKLILISTHFSNTLMKKFADRSKRFLVFTFDDPTKSIYSCIERKKEVFEWIFSKISKEKMNVSYQDIGEIYICIDFNIGHSGENYSPLRNIEEEINTRENSHFHVVHNKDELQTILKDFVPIKLLLTGQGDITQEIPISPHASEGVICEPMTRETAIQQHGYNQQSAINNLSQINRESRDEQHHRERDHLLGNQVSFYSNIRTAEENKPDCKLSCKRWFKKNCTIL